MPFTFSAFSLLSSSSTSEVALRWPPPPPARVCGTAQLRVERGQVDHPQPPRRPRAARPLHDLRLGLLFLELYLVAHQRHLLRGGALGRPGRKDGQGDARPLGPADHLDRVLQRDVDDVLRLLVPLRDGDDAIAGPQEAAASSRPACHQLANLAVPVLVFQLRSDPEQLQAHRHGEALQLLMAHVVRVRVVNVGQSVQVDLQHLVPAELLQGAQLLGVSPGQGGRDLLGLLARQLLLQIVGAQLIAPERLGRRQIARAWRLVAVEGVDLVSGEVNFVERSSLET